MLAYCAILRGNRNIKKHRVTTVIQIFFIVEKFVQGQLVFICRRSGGMQNIKHGRVVVRPGNFSDKVESNLGLWLSVDFILEQAQCMQIILRTSIWIFSTKP